MHFGDCAVRLSCLITGSAEGAIARLKISNLAVVPASGTPQIQLFASSDTTLDPADTPIASLSAGLLRLKKGASKTIMLNFAWPLSLPAGNDFLLALIDPANVISESDEANNVISSGKTIAVAPASIDLTGKFAHLPASISDQRGATVPLTLSNMGNTVAAGSIAISLFASADVTLDASDSQIVSVSAVRINIKPGKSQSIHLRLGPGSATVSGSDFLIAQIDPADSIGESNTANNVSASVSPIAFH